MCYTETLEVISLMLLHRLTKLLLLIFAGRASLMYSSIVDAYDDDLQLSLWWLFLAIFPYISCAAWELVHALFSF